LSKQVLRSGTSIGANIEEADGGQSKKDFIAKIYVAYKEAKETRYWLNLLRDGKILEQEFAESIIRDCEEICRILGKIQLTCNKRNKL
jgi:four helix bundle protein